LPANIYARNDCKNYPTKQFGRKFYKTLKELKEMYLRVLVPIDGSEYSLKAIEAAAKVTDPKKGFATVLTVLEPSVMQLPQTYLERITLYDASIPAVVIPKSTHDVMLERARIIVTKAQEILTSSGIRSEGKVIKGKPVKSIIDEAKAEGSDLIVIGSHGIGGMAKLLLGSVSSRVVEEAPCSVLVVRRNSRNQNNRLADILSSLKDLRFLLQRNG